MNLVSAMKKFSPVQVAHAHCDIPCGIYDPIAAKIAAQTVQKMVMRIQALKAPTTDVERAAHTNTLSRYIAVKEHHAELVRKEIDILWHDYFKPEHVQKHPDLHTTFWNTAKLASKNKQSVDLDAAKQLVDSVDKIAAVFWETKGVTYSDPNAQARFGS
ncbi:MAG: superoxide dismutase, Ni [SAR202 cluster bacterium]|nr:superoxide dismutase, Ni [SAR202 cluster bacterium]